MRHSLCFLDEQRRIAEADNWPHADARRWTVVRLEDRCFLDSLVCQHRSIILYTEYSMIRYHTVPTAPSKFSSKFSWHCLIYDFSFVSWNCLAKLYFSCGISISGMVNCSKFDCLMENFDFYSNSSKLTRLSHTYASHRHEHCHLFRLFGSPMMLSLAM